jgi:hypothetical protein
MMVYTIIWYIPYQWPLQLESNSDMNSTEQLEQKARHPELSLVFFSTFEPIKLTSNSAMQCNGVPIFFDAASSTNLPSLYICRLNAEQRTCWDVCH